MKTRYKIFTIIAILVFGFFTFPPILTSVCDYMGIYDERCPRISGIQVPFVGSVQMWNTIPHSNHFIYPIESDEVSDYCATRWPPAYDDGQCSDDLIDIPDLDKSLTIKFSPLNLKDIELSFDWCTKNNGFWNEDNSTCYFENQKDLNSGMNAVEQYGEKVFGEKENEN